MLGIGIFAIFCTTSASYALLFARSSKWATQRQVQTVVAILLVVPAAIGDQRRGAVRAFLTWRPMVFLGEVSYGFYLWHYLVIKQIGRTELSKHGVWGGMLLLVVAFAISVALATLSYYLLERPVMTWARRRFSPNRLDAVGAPERGLSGEHDGARRISRRRGGWCRRS